MNENVFRPSDAYRPHTKRPRYSESIIDPPVASAVGRKARYGQQHQRTLLPKGHENMAARSLNSVWFFLNIHERKNLRGTCSVFNDAYLYQHIGTFIPVPLSSPRTAGDRIRLYHRAYSIHANESIMHGVLRNFQAGARSERLLIDPDSNPTIPVELPTVCLRVTRDRYPDGYTNIFSYLGDSIRFPALKTVCYDLPNAANDEKSANSTMPPFLAESILTAVKRLGARLHTLRIRGSNQFVQAHQIWLSDWEAHVRVGKMPDDILRSRLTSSFTPEQQDYPSFLSNLTHSTAEGTQPFNSPVMSAETISSETNAPSSPDDSEYTHTTDSTIKDKNATTDPPIRLETLSKSCRKGAGVHYQRDAGLFFALNCTKSLKKLSLCNVKAPDTGQRSALQEIWQLGSLELSTLNLCGSTIFSDASLALLFHPKQPITKTIQAVTISDTYAGYLTFESLLVHCPSLNTIKASYLRDPRPLLCSSRDDDYLPLQDLGPIYDPEAIPSRYELGDDQYQGPPCITSELTKVKSHTSSIQTLDRFRCIQFDSGRLHHRLYIKRNGRILPCGDVLTTLEVAGLTGLTTKALVTLLVLLPELRTLDVTACRDLNGSMKNITLETFPDKPHPRIRCPRIPMPLSTEPEPSPAARNPFRALNSTAASGNVNVRKSSFKRAAAKNPRNRVIPPPSVRDADVEAMTQQQEAERHSDGSSFLSVPRLLYGVRLEWLSIAMTSLCCRDVKMALDRCRRAFRELEDEYPFGGPLIVTNESVCDAVNHALASHR